MEGKMKNKKSWIVTAKCVIKKSIICEGCTEEEAQANPFEYAIDETEIEQIDWEVESVEPNY